jgi:CheY-like chemotaxis protein
MQASELKVNFFMAEDNPGDVTLIREAIEFVGIDVDIEVAIDGEIALERLLNPTHMPPDLIILNFNLPKLQGHQILTEIKRSPRFNGIPVVMLTSSNAQRDRLLCETADAYFVKSGDWIEIVRIVRHLDKIQRECSAKRPIKQTQLAADPFWKQGNLEPQGSGDHPIADLKLTPAAERKYAGEELDKNGGPDKEYLPE